MDVNSSQYASNSQVSVSNNNKIAEQKTLVQISTSSFNYNSEGNLNLNNQHYLKIINHHGMTIKLWECRICGSEFRHQYMLKRHLPGHTDERNYHCNICGKSFRQLSTLTQHKAIHSEARPHTCMTCKKTFNRISTLISHRKTHTDEKPFKCTMCNKGFHQKGNLRNHLYSHTNERPYKCALCTKGFNQQSNLTCHLKKVHGFAGKTNQNSYIQWEAMLPPQSTATPTPTESSINSQSAISVDQIRTPEMEKILQHDQIPFALLKHENNRPVLVRIYTSISNNGKHMLVPVTSTDLISRGELILDKYDKKPSQSMVNADGPLLHLHIPLAAILESKISPEGLHTITVHSPSNYKHQPGNVLDSMQMDATNRNKDAYILPDVIKKELDVEENLIKEEDNLVSSELQILHVDAHKACHIKKDPIMNYSTSTQSTSSTQVYKSMDSSNNLTNPFISSQNILDLPSFSMEYNDIQLFDNLDCMEPFCKKN